MTDHQFESKKTQAGKDFMMKLSTMPPAERVKVLKALSASQEQQKRQMISEAMREPRQVVIPRDPNVDPLPSIWKRIAKALWGDR